VRDSERERAAAAAVWAAMKIKKKMGMSLKTKKKKKIKRILLVAKCGGILPILSLLGIFGLLAAGVAGIAKVVNDNKAAQRQLEELKRHRAMEGHGLYIAPYKSGQGVSTKKKKVQETLKMPKSITTNVQLQQLAKYGTVCAFHILEVFSCVLPYQQEYVETRAIS